MRRTLAGLAIVLTACGTPGSGEERNSTIPEPEKHREVAEACDNERPPGDDTAQSTGGACSTDADCADGMNGRCLLDGRFLESFCNYDACLEDADCGEGSLCVCSGGAGGANICLPNNCRVDADCGASNYCSPSFGDCGNYFGVVAFYCHTLDDACSDDADCEGAEYCAYDPALAHWACSNLQCAG